MVVASWLDDRISQVVVDGAQSMVSPLTDSVFQGTVLGPPLWNQYYSDATVATGRHGYTDTTYADDMNVFKRFDRSASHSTILEDLKTCQTALHQWGSGNCVIFDPGKESFHILHRLYSSNDTFKILGVLFDSKLLMHEAVRVLAIQAGWRLRALLRARRFFLTGHLVMLFKSQVLSYLESGIVAFFHAPISTMKSVDRIYYRFLREIGISEIDAFLRFNLAPLQVRRQIAALGTIHRRVLTLTPSAISALLPFSETSAHAYSTRLAIRLHDKQLEDRASGVVTEMFRRSLFGYVGIYNRLPQCCVDLPNIKSFQTHLQSSLRNQVQIDNPTWREILATTNRTSDIRVF